MNRTPPIWVRRQPRQEVGYGWPVPECSNPYLTSHHSDPPWNEREHHEARRRPRRPSLVYCGDDAAAKEVGATLVRDVGSDPVDAGPLKVARYTEPFALLIAQLASEGEGGPELAYRFERLGR